MDGKAQSQGKTNTASYISNPPQKEHTISYTLFGPSSGSSALVFTHGWTCASSLWFPDFLPLFQSPAHPSRRVVVIDLPGHGASSADLSGETDYNIEFMAGAVLRVLEVCNITSAVIVGHSIGSQVATMALRLQPDKVKGIIYLDAFFRLPEHSLPQVQRRASAEQFSSAGPLALFNMFFTPMATPEIRKRIGEVCERTPKVVRDSVIATDKIPHHWRWDEIYSDLPALHVCTSVEFTDPKYFPEWRVHIPRLEVDYWNEGRSDDQKFGHWVFMEDPERCMKCIEGFLDKHGLL